MDQKKLKANHAAEIIQASCTNAYKVFVNTGLKAYRGSAGHSEFFWGTTGEGRSPQNSSLLLQQITDKALKDHLGPQAAVRSNSIFATGDDMIASSFGGPWGELYVIFPFDTAKFTWSPNYDDLVLDSVMSHWSLINTKSDPNWHQYSIEKLYRLNLAKFKSRKFIKDYDPQTTNWQAALASLNEIMISGDYVAVHYQLLNQVIPD